MKKFIKVEAKTKCLSIKRRLVECTPGYFNCNFCVYLSRTYPCLKLAKLIVRLYCIFSLILSQIDRKHNDVTRPQRHYGPGL